MYVQIILDEPYESVWIIISERLSLCAYASSASIGTVVIAYVYHDASPATLAWGKLVTKYVIARIEHG